MWFVTNGRLAEVMLRTFRCLWRKEYTNLRSQYEHGASWGGSRRPDIVSVKR